MVDHVSIGPLPGSWDSVHAGNRKRLGYSAELFCSRFKLGEDLFGHALFKQTNRLECSHLLRIPDELPIHIGLMNSVDLSEVTLHVGLVTRDVLGGVTLRAADSKTQFAVRRIDSGDVAQVIFQAIGKGIIGDIIGRSLYNSILQRHVYLVGIDHLGEYLLA